MKKLLTLIVLTLASLSFAGVVHADPIPTLDPFFYNNSNQITQRVANSAIKFSGLTPGGCLQLTSGNVATTTGTPCGSGGGGGGISSTTPWTTLNLLQLNANGSVNTIATSSLGLTTSSFASSNISQWTNNSGYITGNQSITLSGAVSGSGTTAITTSYAGTLGNTLGGTAQNSSAWTGLIAASAGGWYPVSTSTPLNASITGNAGTVTNGVYTTGAGTVYLTPTGSAASLTSFPTFNQNTTGSAGSVANSATFNSGGLGAASGATFNGSSALTVSYNTIGAQVAGTYVTGINGTTNQVSSSGGTSPTISLPNLVLIPLDASSTQLSVFGKSYFGGSSTTTIDSSGNIVIPSGASLTNTGVSNGCASWSSGVLTTLGVACGTSSGGITALGNYATTTGTAISISTSTETTNGVTLGVIAAVSNNAILFTPTISGTLANAGLANSTISGVALGGTLGALSHGSTLTGTSYTGTSAVSNWDIDLTHANSWTGFQNFTGGASSSVFSINVGPLYVGGTTATTTISANATSTFATGVNLTTGCITYNGSSCLGSAGTFIGGTSLAVQLATTGTLPANTYSGGVLTEVGTGALTVDGTSASVGNRILVKNEAAQTNNGIYSVTAAGSGIAAYVLTRVSDYNSSANVYPGEATYVIGGSTLADDWWALTTVAPITVGGGGSGSNLTYVETNAASTGVVSVSCPGGFLVCSGTNPASFTIGTLPVANGGTNLTSIGASSTVLTTNGTAASWQQINLGAAVYGLLPLSNGGTNSSLTGASGLVAMNSGNTALSIPSTSYTLSSTLLTAPNASTTNLTVGTSLQIPSAANPEPTVKAYCSQSTNSPYQIQCGNNAGGTSIYDDRTGITFGLASSTVFVGTTTIGVQNVLTGFTATNISCTLQPAGATGEIEWYYANPSAYVSSTPFYFAASSTPGIYAISSNNTPATQATSTLLLGNPSNVTSVSCSPYGPISGI